MNSRTQLCLSLFILLPFSVTAQDPLPLPLEEVDDLGELVKKEQAETDNEAVSVYGGKVGNADAVFFIEWAGTGSPVEGRYYLPARGKNVLYVLKGTNPRPGVLELEEYLEQGEGNLVLNANCKMTKRVAGKRIIWEGEKTYPNGRTLSISFSRGQ